MSAGAHTRRGFLKGAAGAAIGVAAARSGVLDAAGALAADGRGYCGELKLFAGDFTPVGWVPCKGQRLDRSAYPDLFDAIGRDFGGARDGFEPPDLRSRVAAGAGRLPNGDVFRLGDYGQTLAVRERDGAPSTFGLNYLINPRRGNRVLLGEVRAFAYGRAPRNSDWIECKGQELKIERHRLLFSVIGRRFGGDGRETFRVPDLRGMTPVGSGDPPGLQGTPFGRREAELAQGGGTERRPRLHLTYCIASFGDYPDEAGGDSGPDDPDADDGDYIGEVRPFATELPRNFRECDGRQLSIGPNQPLFSVVGSVFGGDGRAKFGLPDLRGRATAGTDERRNQGLGDTSGLGTPPPKLLPYVVVNWGIRDFGGEFPNLVN